jgi:hypothetical protein
MHYFDISFVDQSVFVEAVRLSTHTDGALFSSICGRFRSFHVENFVYFPSDNLNFYKNRMNLLFISPFALGSYLNLCPVRPRRCRCRSSIRVLSHLDFQI